MHWGVYTVHREDGCYYQIRVRIRPPANMRFASLADDSHPHHVALHFGHNVCVPRVCVCERGGTPGTNHCGRLFFRFYFFLLRTRFLSFVLVSHLTNKRTVFSIIIIIII